MVGDHPMDIETAKAAGALSAAVTSGTMKAEAFAQIKPDFMAPDVGSLMTMLRQKKVL